jgi:hypothetical protein
VPSDAGRVRVVVLDGTARLGAQSVDIAGGTAVTPVPDIRIEGGRTTKG